MKIASELEAIAVDPYSYQGEWRQLSGSPHWRLRVWREYRGLTQKELEARSGVQQGYIAQIESGKKTGGIDTLKKLAAALGINSDDLVAAE